MGFELLCLFIIIGFGVLLTFLLSKRYGRSIALKIVIGIFSLSLLIAIVTFVVISKDADEQVFPATEWQLYMVTQQSITKLEYRPDSGLYAITNIGELQITDKNPFCVSDGEIATLEPREIEIADTLPVELSPPPQTANHQINFILFYPIAADEIAFSSFAVFKNGEIWCTERYMRGGPGGAVALGFLTFFYLAMAVVIFLISYVLLFVFAVICLEIYCRRSKKNAGPKSGR